MLLQIDDTADCQIITWCEISCATIVATACSCALEEVAGSTNSEFSRKVTSPQFSMAPTERQASATKSSFGRQ